MTCNKKLSNCDGCQKQRKDVKACGRDSNGEPDAPDLCFFCRKKLEDGKVFAVKEQRYLYPQDKDD